METPTLELVLSVVVPYVLGLVTAGGRLARVRRLLRTVLTAVDLATLVPDKYTVKSLVKESHAGKTDALNAELDAVSPHVGVNDGGAPVYTPRVPARRRILSAVLDVIPIVGAFRRTPR